MPGEGGPSPTPTSAVLMASSKHIAIRCGRVNKTYLECKRRDKDPQACLAQGDGVTRCVIDLCAPGRQVASSWPLPAELLLLLCAQAQRPERQLLGDAEALLRVHGLLQVRPAPGGHRHAHAWPLR